MKRSAIPWTDYSAGDLNFVTGCTPVSEGCANCYAKAIYERHHWDFAHVQTHPEKLERLRRWHIPGKRAVSGVSDAVQTYVRGWGSHPLAFVCDTGDLFHEDVPNSFIVQALGVMRSRPDIAWQILTKRPKRALDLYSEFAQPPNIWFGVTAENQRRVDERIPILLQIPAVVRFVSVEPMLEPVDLVPWLYADPRHGRFGCSRIDAAGQPQPSTRYFMPPRVDWVICGAESGPYRRPFQIAWAEALYWQCQAAGVPCFGKQDSGLGPGTPLLIDGKEIREFPEVG